MQNEETREQIKRQIVTLFNQNVRGKSSDTARANIRHDGRDGHWLETQMGIAHNGNNAPDLFGFEMKNHTTSKTTFGDWSPNIAIFKGKNKIITRDEFLSIFGAPNLQKEGRFSWSGKPCPKIGVFNTFGQKLEIDADNNILGIYSFKADQRQNKREIVPQQFQIDSLELVRWDSEKMRIKVERKFNNLGWFKCNKDSNGIYTSITFGNPINFDVWIEGVKKGLIFFDSGMYAGNPRPYSQWRASNNHWESLIAETH